MTHNFFFKLFTAIGGSLILLQIAHYKGYITVDWNRMANDSTSITDRMREKLRLQSRTASNAWADFAKKNVYLAGGFTGGFFIGIASSWKSEILKNILFWPRWTSAFKLIPCRNIEKWITIVYFDTYYTTKLFVQDDAWEKNNCPIFLKIWPFLKVYFKVGCGWMLFRIGSCTQCPLIQRI